MNKYLTLVLGLLILSFKSLGQVTPPAWEFVKGMGSIEYDRNYGIATDPYGNIYICGDFRSSVTFGTNPIVTLSTSNNRQYVAKYSPQGNLIWVRGAAGTGFTVASGIAVDSFENVYVIGAYDMSPIFGSFTLQNTGHPRGVYVVKYDSNGNVLWATNSHGQSNHNRGMDIAVDSSGNVYVAGIFNIFGGAGRSFGFGNTYISSIGKDDIFLFKLDPFGNPIWGKAAGGTREDEGTAIALDQNGNCYLAGTLSTQSTVTPVYTASFDTITLSASGGPDPFIAKYSPNGAVLWARNPNTSKQEFAYSVTVDHFNNPILGAEDLFRYHSNGTSLSQISPDSGRYMRVFGIVTDSLNNFYLGGLFYSSLGLSFGGDSLNPIYSEDAFVVKLDSSGQMIWGKVAGSNGNEELHGLVMDPVGNLLISGETGFSTSQPVMFDSLSFSPFGSIDFYFAKIGKNPLPVVTSLSEEVAKDPIHLYPNPFSNSFTLQLPASSTTNPQLILQNSLGQTVWKNKQAQVSSTGVCNVRLNSPLAAGIYHLTISHGEKLQHLKIVKE